MHLSLNGRKIRIAGPESAGSEKGPSLFFVHGAEDRLTPPKYSTYLQNIIPSCRLRIIPEAGHMVMAEQPAVINPAIESFVGEIAANR